MVIEKTININHKKIGNQKPIACVFSVAKTKKPRTFKKFTKLISKINEMH